MEYVCCSKVSRNRWKLWRLRVALTIFGHGLKAFKAECTNGKWREHFSLKECTDFSTQNFMLETLKERHLKQGIRQKDPRNLISYAEISNCRPSCFSGKPYVVERAYANTRCKDIQKSPSSIITMQDACSFWAPQSCCVDVCGSFWDWLTLFKK